MKEPTSQTLRRIARFLDQADVKGDPAVRDLAVAFNRVALKRILDSGAVWDGEAWNKASATKTTA